MKSFIFFYINIFLCTKPHNCLKKRKTLRVTDSCLPILRLFLLQCVTFYWHSSCSEKGNDCFCQAEMLTGERRKPQSGKEKQRKRGPEAGEVWHIMCLYLWLMTLRLGCSLSHRTLIWIELCKHALNSVSPWKTSVFIGPQDVRIHRCFQSFEGLAKWLQINGEM